MPEETNPNTPILQGIEQNGEHQLVATSQTTQAVKDLETPLEGMLSKTAEIAENTKPKDVQKMQLVDGENDGDDEQFNQNEAGNLLWKMLRGPKGHTPTDDEIIALIKPLIPEPVKGDRGDDPTEEELLNLINPLIPAAIPGHTPTNDELVALIKPLIPKVKDGDPGETPSDEQITALIKPLIPAPLPAEKAEKITAKKILDLIKGKLSYEDLSDLDNFMKVIAQKKQDISSKDYSTREMTDVSMQGILVGQVLQWDGTRFIPYTPSASSVTQVFGEVVTIATTTGTLAHAPTANTTRLYRNGVYQQLGVDYTVSGTTLTLINAVVGTEVFLIDYNY